MRTLAELLRKKTGKELFLLSMKRKLPFPGEWTESEEKEIIGVYYSNRQQEEYYLEYLQDWENGEFEPLENNSDEAEREVLREWTEHHLRIGRRLRSINENKNDYVEILSKDMLKPESIRSLLLLLKDPCIRIIRDIVAGTVKEENGFYLLACDPDKNWQYLILESTGYALIRKTDPYDEPDDRSHCTGICIPDDVLALIKKVDTAELEAERSMRRILDSIETIVQDYYDAAPIGVVHQVFSVLREESPDRYPALSEEELDRAIVEYAQNNPDKLYDMLTFRGKRYMYNTSAEEITDDTKAEDSYLVAILENWEEPGVKPYIPPLAEMQNYLEYNYWEAKKPFRDLRQFIVEFYMDEQSIEGMCGGIMMMGMDPDERDDYLRKRHYSMDRVLDNADQKFAFLLFCLSGGNEPGEIYQNQKEITCCLSDSAKRKFKRLLKKCYECVPQPQWQGNTVNHSPV
ncbi:MAG: hypothetical protein IJ088_15715 [Clostridia bacterium]|nr:hypothetical protein [Clostridia bacterium]